MTDSLVHALLADNLGNGAILTHNKQVCTHMSVWSHRPVLGEHCIFGIVDKSKLLSSSNCYSALHLFVFPVELLVIIITNMSCNHKLQRLSLLCKNGAL